MAPMDDVTDTVFRQIVAGCAPPDLYFTEFVNVDGLQSPGREKLLHKLRFTKNEKPIIAQLWGLNPENFYKTAREIANGSLAMEANTLQSSHVDEVQESGEAHNEMYKEVHRVTTGADDAAMRHKHSGVASFAERQASVMRNFAGVDLNMGCPVKAVIKNGACAALMNNRGLAEEIIEATREGASKHFPVSVKTRVGFTTVDMSWLELLLTKKLNMLSIYGRSAKQHSDKPPDWDTIGQVRKIRDTLCPATLIVGNGDVMSRAQGLGLADKFKLDGIMIGRGVFADPFVFAQQSPWAGYTQKQKIELYRRHVELFAKTWTKGERRIETLNKFCKVYISGFDGAKQLREKLMSAKSVEGLLKILN